MRVQVSHLSMPSHTPIVADSTEPAPVPSHDLGFAEAGAEALANRRKNRTYSH